MRLGPTNATAALQDGRGAVFNAAREAIAMQTLVAAFERDYSGPDGWQAARQAIADAFGDGWADATLAWVLHVVGAGANRDHPGTETIVRWALSLPVMGALMPALDALLHFKGTDGSGEAARAAVNVVRDSIIAAGEHGVQLDWLNYTLGIWTRTTGGPVISLDAC